MLLRLLICVLLFVPMLSEAKNLVPCGGRDEPACQSCHAVGLINGVVVWLVAILGLIAAIIIVYAGFKLVTSAGNTAAKTQAKSLMTNMFIGYVIVLSAWLVIDYGMKAMVDEGTFGVWNEIQCVEQPIPNYVDAWEGGDISTQCTTIFNGDYNCDLQITACESGEYTIDESTSPPSVVCTYPSGGVRPPDLSAGGACATSVVQPHFGDQTGNAQCIIREESVCGASMVSGSDVMGDGRAFSFGPMQINLTWHELVGCAGYPATLVCHEAFSGNNYTATVIDEGLYQQCARAAQDVTCGLSNGARIFRRDGWGPWSTAGECGLI